METENTLIEFGAGVSQDPDSYEAGVTAANGALKNIRQYPISVVLVYASVHYNLDQVLTGIGFAVGDVLILGTTTAGEILNDTFHQSVTVVVIASPYLSVHAAVGNGVSDDWRKALNQAVENPSISAYIKSDPDLITDIVSSGKFLFAMIFYPGNTRNTSSMGYELLETFKQISLGRIPVFGGASADDWKMENNAVFLGKDVHQNSVLLAIFETQLEVGISLNHGFHHIEPHMTVTAAEGHEIVSLDQKPAANVLANRIGLSRDQLEGKHITLTTGFPLGAPDPLGQYSVNIASYFTERGGVRMTQPVSIGSEITLLVHDAESSALAGQEAIRKAMIRASTNTPALILVHYCALRPRILGESLSQKEISCMLEITGTAATAGFFSFGEDAVADDGISRHNNGAIAVLLLGKQFSATARVAQENKRLQLQIEEHERVNAANLSKVLFENSPTIMAAIDPSNGRMVQVNSFALKTLGYSHDEILTMTVADVTYPDDRTESQQLYEQFTNGKLEYLRFEKRYQRKNGSYFWADVFVSAYKDRNGKVSLIIGNSVDITERKQAEIAIQNIQNELVEAQRIAHIGSWTLDVATNYIHWSEELYLMQGMDPKFPPPDFNESAKLFTPESWEKLSGAISRTVILGVPYELELEMIKPDGRHGWMLGRGEAVRDISGSIVSVRGVALDITDSKLVEESLSITASVFGISQEAILITDAENIIIDVNAAFTRITGYSRMEVIGKNPNVLSSGRQGKDFYENMWHALNSEGIWRGEIWNRKKSGEIYPELLSISILRDSSGKVLRHVAVFSDISNLKQHEDELVRVAHYDALTGIPNRNLLADRMKQAISQTSRDQCMLAVCYLDLDGFKQINDSLGHQVGDEVLIEISRRIGITIRGGDTVARLGGDEFVVLLLGLAKGEECVTTLERMLEVIATPIEVKNNTVSVTASVGVSIYPLDEENPDTLLRHADQAMYIAKQSGKNRFHIYDVELDKRTKIQSEFIKSIELALEQNQFELHYQPKINLGTKELVGVEALIRWMHPKKGPLSPAEFLPHLENSDLDIAIGEWVTATALAQMHDWRSKGLDIEVSINISGYHLESRDFVSKLQQQLSNYPSLPFGKLQIEVLETVALNDIAVVKGVIESCRKIGVGFALDDFGTGYSSLSYLSGLPVDTLKIDQSFVRDMLEDKGDKAIVQGIIALAKAFERQTVAEGIETDEHYQALFDMGCEIGQGYGIARPMPAGDLAGWEERYRQQSKIRNIDSKA